MTDYTDLVKSLRRCAMAARCRGCKYHAMRGDKDRDCHELLLSEAADAIDKLADKVDRAVAFCDSPELAGIMRQQNEWLISRATDLEWQKAHAEMGFYSPLYDAINALGAADRVEVTEDDD